MNYTELHILVEKYFQGETTLDEERELKTRLYALKENPDNLDSVPPTVAEALAVFSYVDMEDRKNILADNSGHIDDKVCGPLKNNDSYSSDKKSGRRFRRWIIAAAAVVTIVMAGVGVIQLLSIDRFTGCSTMIACREDNSSEAAFKLISSQLSAIGEASDNMDEEIQADLQLIGDIVE